MIKKLALLFVLIVLTSYAVAQQQYDVLIRNGRVVDGSGNPWTYADIGVVGDRIAFVGKAGSNVTAKRTIDATGLVVAPGFIDMLGQSEFNLLVDKQAVSKLTQGVTTEITGEGDSIAPTNDKLSAEYADVLQHYNMAVDWRSLDEYFKRLAKQGSGVNLGTYVGAAQVRRLVIGTENREPTPGELKDMEDAVDDAMGEGAMGLSTSLIYAPGNYAKTEELIALAKVAGARGGVYASHMRSEGDAEFDALNEAFRIGREAKIPVQVFHLKVAGKQNWGNMPKVIAAIEAARASGLDVTANQYPYVAGGTSLGAIVPPKYHAGGADAFVTRLKDPATRAQIRSELQGKGVGFENLWLSAGGDGAGILIAGVLNPDLKKYEGKTVAQAATMEGKDPLDAALDLVVADRDNVGAMYFMMSEDEVKLAMQQPWVSVGTDHPAVNTSGPLSEGKAHPRGYGSFARILGKYVRDEHVISLEDAIRKFTSLPAQQVRLENRGLLRTGYFADITIFNPATVKDVATFDDPNRTSVGFAYVFVNGVLSVENDKVTGQLGGRPLRGPGYAARDVAPDGLPPRGKVQGMVTDDDGYPVPRTKVTLADADGRVLGTATTKKDGKYEFPLDAACRGCTVRAERMGFVTQSHSSLNYNGSNSLWFGFVMKKQQLALGN